MFTPYLSRDIWTSPNGEQYADSRRLRRVRTNPYAPWIIQRLEVIAWTAYDDWGTDYAWNTEVVL